MFLLEKLPKDAAETADEPTGKPGPSLLACNDWFIDLMGVWDCNILAVQFCYAQSHVIAMVWRCATGFSVQTESNFYAPVALTHKEKL